MNSVHSSAVSDMYLYLQIVTRKTIVLEIHLIIIILLNCFTLFLYLQSLRIALRSVQFYKQHISVQQSALL